MQNFVTVALDESGSMRESVDGALDGVNGFFWTLREQPLHLRVSLMKFNDAPSYVYEREYLANVRDVTRDDYQPDGGTALYVAVLRAIADLEPHVAAHEARATVVIVSDGQDTTTGHPTMADVKRVVEAKLATKRWTFLYFGPEGAREASGMGIPREQVYALMPGSSEEIKAAFEVAAAATVKQLTAGGGPIVL